MEYIREIPKVGYGHSGTMCYLMDKRGNATKLWPWQLDNDILIPSKRVEVVPSKYDVIFKNEKDIEITDEYFNMPSVYYTSFLLRATEEMYKNIEGQAINNGDTKIYIHKQVYRINLEKDFFNILIEYVSYSESTTPTYRSRSL